MSETAFYPTSGGQPHDTGQIGGVEVLDVYEADGDIIHVLRKPITDGPEVSAEVNWTRRHDHMQHHTGQHVLSQALVRICDIPTIGFTIGPDWSTIVLPEKPSPESLDAALRLANDVVDENRPVDVFFPNEAELEAMPVRGTLHVQENTRIIRVEGFDWSPCGGTHSSSTGDVRLIIGVGLRKEKDKYRLEFVCGRRAERLALEYARTVSDTALLLDAGPSEISDRTRALLERIRFQDATIKELREARLVSDCEHLVDSSVQRDGGIIATILENRTIQELQQLAHMLVVRHNTVALLIGTSGNKIGLAFARSEDRIEDMSRVMKGVCGAINCRGGGNAAFATGGGTVDVPVERVLEQARKSLRED